MRKEIEVRVFEVTDDKFDYVEELMDDECDEYCCECCPYTEDKEEDDEDPELEYITDKAVELVELIELGVCPECAFKFVVDLYETAYENGSEDFRLGLVEDLLTENEC